MKLACLVLCLASSVAAADPTHYVQTDVMIGMAAPVVGFNAMAGVEGGSQLQDAMWLHGAISYGPAADDQGTGTNALVRAGVEFRSCVLAWRLCGVAGADGGVQHGTWTSGSDAMERETTTAVIVAPRAGVDAGGQHVRFRLGLEVDVPLAGRHTSTNMPTTPGGGGIELATGVAYQW